MRLSSNISAPLLRRSQQQSNNQFASTSYPKPREGNQMPIFRRGPPQYLSNTRFQNIQIEDEEQLQREAGEEFGWLERSLHDVSGDFLNRALDWSDSSFFLDDFLQPSLMDKRELKLISKRRVKKSGSTCVVCHCHYVQNEVVRVLPCGHVFHYKCLKPWFKQSNNCPVCRLDVRSKIREINASRFRKLIETGPLFDR